MRTGKADERTVADVSLLGESLARIHTAGETYAGPASFYRLEGAHLLQAPLAQILDAPVVDAELRAEYAALGETLAGHLAARAPALLVGACHGDNHGGNTLIAEPPGGEPAAGWFDFDDGGPGFLAYDLATFIWNFLSHARGATLSEATAALWAAFITGYRQARSIPEADFEAIGLLVAIRHVNFVGQYASRIPQWGAGFVTADWLRDQLALIRKWDDLVTPVVAVAP
jgi:Ser/Thr protein kinase RdoA (MazF antagonist)